MHQRHTAKRILQNYHNEEIHTQICAVKYENFREGLDKYEKTIKNYFIDMADEEIIDGDLLLVLICIIIQKI